MKTSSIKLLLVVLIFNFSSCKQGSGAFSDYQFADQPAVITCADTDNKLLNEALYSFEKDIISFYDINNKNANRVYKTFTQQATSDKADLTRFVSKHSFALANALKDAGFISEKGVISKSPILKCIAENMQKEDIKTTFNALVSTNSMRRELFNPALQIKTHKVHGDKYLSLFVALEYFYSDILKTDFTNVDFNRPEPIIQNTRTPNITPNSNNGKVDFNKRPARQ